jgi:hypothetical protein
MRLTREQSQKLLQERDIWITDACNKCGQLLGAVRWIRRGEPGEWCSELCRDDATAAAKLTEVRGLVRRKYATIDERITARRKADRKRKASRTAKNTGAGAL